MSDIQSVSDEIVFLEASAGVTAVVEIDSTHIMVADRFNARVGTIANGSVTFGSDYAHIDAYFDIELLKIDSTHILVICGYSNKGGAFIATIDGDSITYGSITDWQPAANGTNDISAIMLDATHFCISFRAANTNNRGRSIIGTIDGANLTFGSEYQFFSNYSNYISSCKVDDTHFCIVFRDETTAGDPECSIIGTVSNENEISFGSIYQFNGGIGTYHTSIVAVDSTHVWTFFVEDGAYCNSGTINGNVITWGTAESFNIESISEPKAVLVDSSTILIAFNDWEDGAKGTVKTGTIDGSNITFSDNITINNERNEEPNIALIGDNIVVTTYYDGGTGYGILVMITYPAAGGYVRPDYTTGLYNISSVKGNLRGKASEGFIRPTLKQFFTSENFEEIVKSILIAHTEDLCTPHTNAIDSAHFEGRAPWRAFYDTTGNFDQSVVWESPRDMVTYPLPQWIGYNFGINKIIVKYTITSTNTVAHLHSPRTWEFQGSIGDDWVTLDTRIDELGWNQWEKREYTFENTTGYSMYRLLISAKSTTDPGGGIYIDEIEMMEGIYESGPGELVGYTEDKCEGGIISSLSEYSPVTNLINNSSSSWINYREDIEWVQYQFLYPHKIEKLTLSSDSLSLERHPNVFMLQGSTTGVFGGEEITLLTEDHSGSVWWTINETKIFTFNNNNRYLYYRLILTGKDGSYGKDAEYYLQEMEMMEGIYE